MRTYRKYEAYEPAVASRTHKVFDKILRRNRGRYAAAAHFVQSEYNQQIKLHLDDMRDTCLDAMCEARRKQVSPCNKRKKWCAFCGKWSDHRSLTCPESGYGFFGLLGLVADIRAAVGDKEGRLMQDELVERCRQLHELLSTIVGSSPSTEEQNGDLVCFFCYAYLDYGQDHDPDCPYLLAKNLIKDV